MRRLTRRLDGVFRRIALLAISAVAFDISDDASVRDIVASVVEKHGRIDVAVNATFCKTDRTVEALSAEEFDEANRVNLTGSFLLARECARAMTQGGSIIMFASMYGIVVPDLKIYHEPMIPNPVEYGVGKAGMIQMVRYLAAHYGRQRIRVNAVAPGPFPWQSQQDADPEFMGRLADRTMLGRIGRRDEMAGAVVYLASDEASYVTGHVLKVDGGWTAW